MAAVCILLALCVASTGHAGFPPEIGRLVQPVASAMMATQCGRGGGRGQRASGAGGRKNMFFLYRNEDSCLRPVIEKTAPEVQTTMAEQLLKYHMCAKTYDQTQLCAYLVPVL